MFHTKTLALLLGIAPFASIFMANAIPIDNSTITRRQAVGTITELEGNGNPHQNYLHQQISEIITCDQDAGCSAGESITESFSVSWSFGIGKKVTEWISGGFSVQESWSTGNNYVCQGAASDTVCIWYNTAHTAYTVKEATTSIDGPGPFSDALIRSPNDQNLGGGYYCVVGTCQTKGAQYWEDGCAGGPQSNCGNGNVIQ